MNEETDREPTTDDPGGAHAKGYSADPAPESVVPPTDPVPLAAGPDKNPTVYVPERATSTSSRRAEANRATTRPTTG